MEYIFNIFLVLLSSFFHSLWHFFLKKNDSEFQLFLISFFSLIFSAIFVLSNEFNIKSLFFYKLILVSVILHNLYKISLIQIYRSEKFSDSYLTFKSINFLIIFIFSIFFFKENYTLLNILSIFFIYFGIFLIFQIQKNFFFFKAFLCGLFMAGYTIIDVFILRQSHNVIYMIFLLIFFDNLLSIIIYSFFRINFFKELIWSFNISYLIAPFLAIMSFVIFLYVLNHENIALTVSLRETSVIFSLILGVFYLNEKLNLKKLFSYLLVLIGVFLNFL